MTQAHPIGTLLASNLCGGPAFKPPSDVETAKALERLASQQRHAITGLIEALDQALCYCAEHEFGMARGLLAHGIFSEDTRFPAAGSLVQQLGNLRRLLTLRHDDVVLPFVLHSVRTGLAELIGRQD